MSNPSSEYKHKGLAAEKATGKAPFSMALKLNFHTLTYTLGVLIAINIILCLTILSLSLWNVEKTTAFLIADHSSCHKQFSNYRFQDIADKSGITLLSTLHRKTPLQDYDVSRRITIDRKNNHPLSTLEYQMVFPEENITVTYGLGQAVLDYKKPLLFFLGLEGFILFLGIGRNKRKIRKILQPLSVMSKQAQNLTSASVGEMNAEEMKRLRELAGTISNIDATKLDKRLPVDGVQDELKDLASAINNMLNRIDEAYRSQVRFVSDASHELRTPISVIQGYVNLLDRWGKYDEVTLQESIDAIKSESENMKDLIEQLLFLARGDNETLRLNLELFNCSDMIEENLKETQLIDTDHSFSMKTGSSAYIKADRQLLKQALRILLENSMKYTPAGGEIVISVYSDDNTVSISVQDNGIGIDPNDLPYIFNRFYRSDESRARKTGGSGLGLSIMKWIIDRHGGSIEVVSRKEIGTRTTILLPRAEDPKFDENE